MVDVAAGIVLDGPRVLVTRRRREGPLGGLWEFPGGKIEPGETPAAALARELAEELGVRVRVGPLWGVLRHRYPERHVRLHFHFAEIEDGAPRPLEVEALRWVDPPALAALPFPPADRPLVQALLECHREGASLQDSRLTSDARKENR